MANPDWTPLVADVGAILRARTKDTNGTELGTFTVNTRPTAVETQALINSALSDVLARTGPIPAALVDFARRVVTFGGALLVELSYYPEQIRSGRSPYPELKEWYDSALERLVLAVTDVNSGGDVGGDDTGIPLPIYAFPTPYTVGFETQW